MSQAEDFQKWGLAPRTKEEIEKTGIDVGIAKKEIQTPNITYALRLVGSLLPFFGFATAGMTNMETGPGSVVIFAAFATGMVFFALGSVVRLLNRIDYKLGGE